MNRRIPRWLLVLTLGLLVAAGMIWRVLSSREETNSVPLSTGEFNVRFLTAGLGTLNYSSDDTLRQLLRPRLPRSLAKRLGDVTNVRGFTSSPSEFGGPPLVLLFQLLTPENRIQNDISIVFSKVEFPESSGFVFSEGLSGYSSVGQGSSIHDCTAFPRRDPTLHFRLYEANEKLLMEKSIPNPGYRTDFPVWTPEEIPATRRADGLAVTLTSLEPHLKWRQVRPLFEVKSDHPSWESPNQSHTWTDATGNDGPWLSPFEPAWKLHLRLRRRREAKFPTSATWTVGPLAVPQGLTLTNVGQENVVDGIRLRVAYVAPAAEVRNEGGTITLKPPRNPGNRGVNLSSGSTSVGGKMVKFSSVDSGLPFLRLDHDPLPEGVELLCDVRDENGRLLNDNLPPGRQADDGVHFQTVFYAPGPETRAVSLELRVSRPRDFEFVVAPPTELRDAVKATGL